jgi:hypothetical protein
VRSGKHICVTGVVDIENQRGWRGEINSIPGNAAAEERCCILGRGIKIHIKTFEPREISPQDLLESSKILFMNDMFSVGLCRLEGEHSPGIIYWNNSKKSHSWEIMHGP